MKQPRLLDLFCGAGGAGVGYAQAGFDVIGVDITPQPHYPFPFIQADALTFPLEGYDVVHASVPCQAFSAATVKARQNGNVYPDYLALMRERVKASSSYWILENVPGAPMQHGILLCGSMFGLRVRRHRYFETSHLLFAPRSCKHTSDFVTIYGDEVLRQRRNPLYTGLKCGVRSQLVTSFPHEVGQKAMGIEWMNAKELSQAIPPAYTQWVGQHLQVVLS